MLFLTLSVILHLRTSWWKAGVAQVSGENLEFDFTFIFFSHKFITISPHLFVFSLHPLPAQTVFP